MTTIIAVETPDKVIIGCDSQVSMGFQKDDLDDGKVFRNGEYTFAVAGHLRMLQALQHSDLPAIESDDLDWHVSEVFAQHYAAVAKRAKVKGEESVVLMAIRGRVYLMAGDGAYVRNRSGVYSVGSGSQFALGALAHVPSPTKDDVERALKAAARYDLGTSGPFKIFTV